MITPEQLNAQVDILLQRGRLPDVAARCAEIEHGASAFLAKVNTTVSTEIGSRSATLRDRCIALVEKQKDFFSKSQAFQRRCQSLSHQLEMNQQQIVKRAADLRDAVDQRKKELEFIGQQRWHHLQLEIAEYLVHCRRQVEAAGAAQQQQQQQQGVQPMMMNQFPFGMNFR